MSRENVEAVRRSTDALNRGDPDEALAHFAPEAEWHTTGRFADRGVYRGRAGLEKLWAEIGEDFEEWGASISDIRAVGEDKVLISMTWWGRGKRSKALIEQPLWYVSTLRDGLIVRVEAYADSVQALKAAGLRE